MAGTRGHNSRSALRHRRARGIRRRILTLSVAAVVLYGVAPAVLEVLGAYRRLTDVDPAWWIVGRGDVRGGHLVHVRGPASGLERRALVSRGHIAACRSRVQQGRPRRLGCGRRAAGSHAQPGRSCRRRRSRRGSLPARCCCSGRWPGCRCWRCPRCCSGGRIPMVCSRPPAVGLAVFVVLFAVGALLLRTITSSGQWGEDCGRPT